MRNYTLIKNEINSCQFVAMGACFQKVDMSEGDIINKLDCIVSRKADRDGTVEIVGLIDADRRFLSIDFQSSIMKGSENTTYLVRAHSCFGWESKIELSVVLTKSMVLDSGSSKIMDETGSIHEDREAASFVSAEKTLEYCRMLAERPFLKEKNMETIKRINEGSMGGMIHREGYFAYLEGEFSKTNSLRHENKRNNLSIAIDLIKNGKARYKQLASSFASEWSSISRIPLWYEKLEVSSEPGFFTDLYFDHKGQQWIAYNKHDEGVESLSSIWWPEEISEETGGENSKVA